MHWTGARILNELGDRGYQGGRTLLMDYAEKHHEFFALMPVPRRFRPPHRRPFLPIYGLWIWTLGGGITRITKWSARFGSNRFVVKHSDSSEAPKGLISLDNLEAIRTRRIRDMKPYKRVASELGISESPTTNCVRKNVRVNRFAEVIYKTNRYSVPARLAYRDAIIEVSGDRIYVFVDTILFAEHEITFGKHKASLDVIHFIDLLSFEHHGIVLEEVLRRRRFHQSLQSLLNGYVESKPASASKRFMRVVALLEDHTMQEVYDAIRACTQSDPDELAAIALILKQTTRPFDPDDDPLRVFDTEEWPSDSYNVYQERFAPIEDLQLTDID